MHKPFCIMGMAQAQHLPSQDRPSTRNEICQTSDATCQTTRYGNKVLCFLQNWALIVRPSVSCFTTSYTCKNCTQNSFRMHRHIHLPRCANIWRKKYSHVATRTLQPRPRPCDFFLFTKLKSVLKGTRFDDLEEIKANTTRVLKALTSSDFKSCVKTWER